MEAELHIAEACKQLAAYGLFLKEDAEVSTKCYIAYRPHLALHLQANLLREVVHDDILDTVTRIKMYIAEVQAEVVLLQHVTQVALCRQTQTVVEVCDDDILEEQPVEGASNL